MLQIGRNFKSVINLSLEYILYKTTLIRSRAFKFTNFLQPSDN